MSALISALRAGQIRSTAAGRGFGNWHLRQSVSGVLKLAPGGQRKRRGLYATDLTERLFNTPDFDPRTLLGVRNRAIASAAQLGLARSQMFCVSS
jgi:hypothetical protein